MVPLNLTPIICLLCTKLTHLPWTSQNNKKYHFCVFTCIIEFHCLRIIAWDILILNYIPMRPVCPSYCHLPLRWINNYHIGAIYSIMFCTFLSTLSDFYYTAMKKKHIFSVWDSGTSPRYNPIWKRSICIPTASSRCTKKEAAFPFCCGSFFLLPSPLVQKVTGSCLPTWGSIMHGPYRLLEVLPVPLNTPYAVCDSEGKGERR